MANKVTIDLEARFIDNTGPGAQKAADSMEEIEQSAKDAQKAVDKLSKEKAKPKVDADDSKLIKKLKDADAKLDKLGRSKTETKLGAVDKASNVILRVMNKAKSFAGKTYNAMVSIRDSGAMKALNNVLGAGEKIAGKTWKTAVRIVDYATKPLRTIKNMLFSIKTLVAAVTAGLAAKALVATPVALADAYSSAKIGFSTLLGESQGQQMMDELDVFAKATPFKSAEVISQSQRMLAMGWDVENIIDDMGTIGDAAAATGKGEQGLQRIVTALSQIKSKGRLSTEELNQLAEAGISAKRYIAEGLGYGSGDKGIAKMTKDLENGAIGSEAALKALLSGMEEYSGMMEKTANETVQGLWSQIEDTFEINIFRRWGQGLQDGAKRGFGSIVTLLEEAEGALSEFGDMVYDIGKTISNWLADKLEKVVERITKITDSFEFKNASLGEKISMLWKGVVTDPLKEWWENGGRQKTAETAGKIGAWMGEMLTKGLLAIFGATDILDEDVGSDAGESIAGSFLQGFLDNFDGDAITQAFVDAISNVWGALPTWAKFLIGGYAGGKAISGIGNVIGGIANIVGTGGNIVGSATKMTGLLGLGTKTAIATGAGNLAGGASLGAGALSTIGLAEVGGVVAGTYAAGKGIYDLYKANKALNEGNMTEMWANTASGGTALGGVGAGAAAGAAIGSIIPGLGTLAGGLIGAGIGGIAGLWAGSKWAESIRRDAMAATAESEELKAAIKDTDNSAEDLAKAYEKAVYQNMKSHLGDMKLSLSEIQRLTDQIVWGDDQATYDKFTSATKNAEANLQSLQTAYEQSDKWLWKASLGVKFNKDERDSIKQSFDDYISSAKALVENKHYEFTAAVSLLVDTTTKDGKSILSSGDAFFTGLQEQVNSLGSKLSGKVKIALEDGVITLDESKEIINLQEQIAAITNKLADAETEAELELVKVKFGKGNLDLDSFETFMSTMQTTLDERMTGYDEAFTTSVASLKLQLDEGAIDKDEYEKQLKALVEGYEANVENLRAEIKNVELEIIGEAYDIDKKTLEKALDKSLSEGINPKEWTADEARKFLGVKDLSDEAAGAIAQMLGGVADQLELTEIDGKLYYEVTGVETDKSVEETVDDYVPDSLEEVVGVNIKGEKEIQDNIEVLVEDFGIEPEMAAALTLLLTSSPLIEEGSKYDHEELAAMFGIEPQILTSIKFRLDGAKSVEEKINILASDFGIPKQDAATVLWLLHGTKEADKVSVTADDFDIPSSISKTISVNLKAVKGKVTSTISKIFGGDDYRGGIEGGSSSMDAFARGGIAKYSDGGIAQGGAKLITVAEEGDPEMIIPLGSQRRDRGLKLWAKAGEMLGVNKYARGGLIGGNADEGIRFHHYGTDDSNSGGQSVLIEVGGITVEIHVNATGTENIAEAIKEQANEIAETLAGIMADALGSQFENTPLKGGVA